MTLAPEIEERLQGVLQALQQVPLIQEYQAIEAKVRQHQGLQELEEAIKASQQAAVNFAYYGKVEAERQALLEANAAQERYQQHPLVLAYREKLLAVDELLHYLTDKIQYQVNESIEKKLETPGT